MPQTARADETVSLLFCAYSLLNRDTGETTHSTMAVACSMRSYTSSAGRAATIFGNEGELQTMSMETPRDLLIHELSDMMSAENIVLKMLPELAKEARHPELKDAFKDHEKETKEQIKRLEAAFKELGEKPEQTTCYGTEGLKKEHEALHEEKPAANVLEMGNILGAAKTEHYEIASYTGLAQLAKDLGETGVADLLKENLAEEEAMAKKLTALAKELGKEAKQAEKASAN